MYRLQKQTLDEVTGVNSEDAIHTQTSLPSPFSKIHFDGKESALKALGRMQGVKFGINSKTLFLKHQNHL